MKLIKVLMDGFLQNDIHLKSSFDKTKYIFDQSILECNGHFDDWFSNTKAFLCGIWNLCRENLYPSGSADLVLHSPSIDAWSMAEMLWQCIHEIFIY